MLEFTPNRLLDEIREEESRRQERMNNAMKQAQEESHIDMGNLSIGDKLDEQNKYIAEIAENAKSQADSAKIIAKNSNSHSIVAILISVATLIIEIILNRQELLIFIKSLLDNYFYK